MTNVPWGKTNANPEKDTLVGEPSEGGSTDAGDDLEAWVERCSLTKTPGAQLTAAA